MKRRLLVVEVKECGRMSRGKDGKIFIIVPVQEATAAFAMEGNGNMEKWLKNLDI